MITEWFEKEAVLPRQKVKLNVELPKRWGLTPESAKALIKGRPPGGLGLSKFVGGMTKQEMQVRLDEASKMINPENMKFLPPDMQQRTGLEMNPLWMLECMVRSGALASSPGQMVNALKTLADYTYSKAPSLNQSLIAHASAESLLDQLAEEYFPKANVTERVKAKSGESVHSERNQRYLRQPKTPEDQKILPSGRKRGRPSKAPIVIDGSATETPSDT